MGEEVKIKIANIFYSIQGEGVNQGVPTTFIRFQGCNLLEPGCVWCDTQYARGEGGTLMTVGEILDTLVKLQPKTYQHWVCITGGEPLFQPNGLHELVKSLNKYGFRIEVETNGSLPKPFWWTLVDSWVADIKCPGSGVCGVSKEEEWFDTRKQDQVKFVVGSQEDIDYARSVIMRNMIRNPTVLISPVIDKKGRSHMAVDAVMLCLELKVRFSFQIHKYVGVE
jgi:7-carboxy-7-deazaguanine synthase